MTDNNLQQLADRNTELFFDRFDNCKTAAEVDHLVTDMRANLKSPLFEAVIDNIEASVTQELLSMPPQIKNGLRLLVSVADSAKNSPSLKNDFRLKMIEQKTSLVTHLQLIHRLSEIKGDSAGPVVKGFAVEAAKLTDEQYSNAVDQARLVLTVLDSLSQTQPVKVNPFKKSNDRSP